MLSGAEISDQTVTPAKAGIHSLSIEDDIIITEPRTIEEFQALIWDYYHEHRRDMPWRETADPYAITISEVMLQQTQVSRVFEKFPIFMAEFPNFKSLAQSSTAKVIKVWQGLGYNRRALNLQRLAISVERDHNGELPSDPTELIKLPGIGPHTAGSIAAFAFNYPSVFIETNIRRVFIHHFFGTEKGLAFSAKRPGLFLGGAITDKQLFPLIEAALDRENPREWYWALMDYGAMLAKTVPNPNRRSKHYSVQTKFEGSQRQLRGLVLRTLSSGPSDLSGIADPRRDDVITELISEGFIRRSNGQYEIG